MRIFAIETVYRSPGSKTPGVDNIVLGKENLLSYLGNLTEANLLKYTPSAVRRVFIPKGKRGDFRPLGIPTIGDRIIQTLFVQILEPIIDPHADVYSFGYRKGRSAHQAIGELSRILYVHPYNKRKSENRRYFYHTRYLCLVDIKGFSIMLIIDFYWRITPFPKNTYTYLLVG